MLVSSTDGVGTKSLIARLAGRLRHHRHRPRRDVGRRHRRARAPSRCSSSTTSRSASSSPTRSSELVAGVAEGCRQAGCALLGGEMSEHPGVMEPGEFDLVGFAVGVVERDAVLPGATCAPATRIVGFAQPGPALQRLLARPRGAARARRPRPRRPGVAGRAPLARRRAAPAERDLRARDAGARANGRRCTRSRTSPAAASPATSRGCCPTDCDAVVDRGTWDEPRIFAEIQRGRRRRRRRDGPRVQPRPRHAGRRRARRPIRLRWILCARPATKRGSSERCQKAAVG